MWLPKYVQALLGFPNHCNDGPAGSTSQALEWIQRRYSELNPERQMPDTRQLPRAMQPKGRVKAPS